MVEDNNVAAGVIKCQIRAIKSRVERLSLLEQLDEISPNVCKIQRRDCSDDCLKWLKNSWNTERILRMSKEYIGDNPFALQWSFPQAYYAVFCLYQALVVAQGNNCLSHTATLKEFAKKIEKKFFPDDLSFALSGGPKVFYRHNLLECNYEVLSFNEFDIKSVDSQIFHFLCATRKECISLHKPEYLKRFKRKRLLKGEDESVAAEVENTTLLHLLYRKRIKANYKDIDTFLSELIDSEQICDDLAAIVWRVNSVLEFYISRYIGVKKLEKERESFDLYSEMDWLAERMKLYSEYKR